MPDQVKVEDFEVFRVFRAALLKFAQISEQSLSNADSQIARAHSWLESEQSTYWQGQLRKRMEATTKARDAVRQKKLYKDSSGRTPNAAEEEKILARCLAAVEQAQEKIEAVRKSLPKLEREAEQYRGGVARLNGVITVDVPKAVALLDRLAATLEEYVQIEAPVARMPESTTASTFGESISRGGDAAGESQPKADAAPPATADGQTASAPPSHPETPPRKEGQDVADGK